MREVLIRSPSGAFAFGINASQFEGACAPTGPSQAARPPAELGRNLLRWHRCCYHSGQPFGCEEVFVWGRSPGELYISPAMQHHVQETVMLLPVGPLYHGTPKHDSVGKVLENYSHLCARNRQVRTPFIPWLKPRGFLAARL
jgi:hypothetical protein